MPRSVNLTMSILIAYYTSTKNTEKIAHAIKDGLPDHDVELLDVEFDTKPISMSGYDLVIFGSGVYLGIAAGDLTEFVKNAIDYPKRFAVFYSSGRKEPYPHAFDALRRIMSQHSSIYLGEFYCFGEPYYYYSDDDYREAQRHHIELGFHPDEKDFENALNFVKSIL